MKSTASSMQVPFRRPRCGSKRTVEDGPQQQAGHRARPQQFAAGHAHATVVVCVTSRVAVMSTINAARTL
jgi:hypothetical protein